MTSVLLLLEKVCLLQTASLGSVGDVQRAVSLTSGTSGAAVAGCAHLHLTSSRCGNGLLTHILASEGYAGHGLDLRARTSWEHYPSATRSQLHVVALVPTTPELDESYLPRGSFLIGNHADELTPWIPVLAARAGAAGYLSIPCCAWSFDARFDRARDMPYEVNLDEDRFIENLNLGADGSRTSGYVAYRIWIASLSIHCGWQVECETLRIPSTRNWAIIGLCP
jgi:tRNASer (uridine44-2'-O)-methyltransferase